MARSKNRIVTVYKHPVIGTIPNFIQMAQRHLEKDKPHINAGPGPHEFEIPVDLVALTVGEEIGAQIESVTLAYVNTPVQDR